MISWSTDIWDKYWPTNVKERGNLEARIRTMLEDKGNSVQTVAFTDIPAQQDALGARTVISIRSATVDSSLTHDYVAGILGINS